MSNDAIQVSKESPLKLGRIVEELMQVRWIQSIEKPQDEVAVQRTTSRVFRCSVSS